MSIAQDFLQIARRVLRTNSRATHVENVLELTVSSTRLGIINGNWSLWQTIGQEVQQ